MSRRLPVVRGRFRRLTRSNDPCWHRFMTLYETTFKEGEKEPRASLEAQLCPEGREATGAAIAIGFVTARDRVDGGIILSYLNSVNCGFISYLVVSPLLRCRGVGTQLFEEGKTVLQRAAESSGHVGVAGVFTELEKESPAEPRTLRRFRFWERLGVLPLDMEWVYPQLAPGRPPLSMYLAYGAFDGHRVWTAAGLARAATAIFRSTYADVAGAEAALQTVLAGLASHPPNAPIGYRSVAGGRDLTRAR